MTEHLEPQIARLLQADRQHVRAALEREGIRLSSFQSIDWRHTALYLALCVLGIAALAVGWSLVDGAWRLILVPPMAILQHAMLNVVHEASHYSLLTDKRWNDRLASLFAALPLGHTVASYRMTHNDHHNYLRTAKDPSGYVTQPDLTAKEIRRTLVFLLCGRLLWELIARSLLGRRLQAEAAADESTMKKTDRDRLVASLIFHLVALFFWSALGLLGFWLTWLVVVMTLTPFLDGIRTIVEHRTPPGSTEPFHTRSYHANPVVSALMAPLFQYHWEHHLFPAIPHHRLADLHRTVLRLDVAEAKPVDSGFFGTLWQLT